MHKLTRDISILSLFLLAATILTTTLVACGGGGGGSASSTSTTPTGSAGSGSGTTTTSPTLSLAAQVGQKLFFDQNLSGGKNMSCASCHSPQYAYGPPNSLSVQLGSDGVSEGQRAVPSLRYKSMTPEYNDSAENPDGVSQNAPGGGFMWDGRAASLAAQASLPLLNPIEMNNSSASAVVQTVQNASYAALFQQAFGSNVFNNPTAAFADIGAALQAFQQEDQSFAPYSSKYDLYISNKQGGQLTAAEMRGLRLFNTIPDTGSGESGAGCVACHYSGANFHGSVGLMTDFTYQALGVPRNDAEIPGNTKNNIPGGTDSVSPYASFDMGLCGPDNTLHAPSGSNSGAGNNQYNNTYMPDPYCGRFKVPTLRNVSTRNAFFHNGVFHSLVQVLNFYNTRDTNPEFWYPSSGGNAANVTTNPSFALYPTYAAGAKINQYNDLPAQYQGNIDTEMPMGQGSNSADPSYPNNTINMGGTTIAEGALPRAFHSAPQMSQQDMSDLLCFLQTLTDGYQPPVTPPTSGICVN